MKFLISDNINIDINEAVQSVSLHTFSEITLLNTNNSIRKQLGGLIEFQEILDSLPQHFFQLAYLS